MTTPSPDQQHAPIRSFVLCSRCNRAPLDHRRGHSRYCNDGTHSEDCFDVPFCADGAEAEFVGKRFPPDQPAPSTGATAGGEHSGTRIIEVLEAELHDAVAERDDLRAKLAHYRQLEDVFEAKSVENERLQMRVAELEIEVARRREQASQAFDAIDGRRLYKTKHFAKYPCECGATISNAGYASRAHLRGTLHRQNMERKALGLEPV